MEHGKKRKEFRKSIELHGDGLKGSAELGGIGETDWERIPLRS